VTRSRILVIGYGNPGRGDDGLGPALAAAIEALDLPEVTVETDFQLTVDHAPLIAGHDLVVFADAAFGLSEPFRLTEIQAGAPLTLGSHQVSPEAALHLAWLLYAQAPPGWTLAISGAEFGEIREGLSRVAQENLGLAVPYLEAWIAQRAIGRTGRRTSAGPTNSRR
jgi:hydrogenase maturation protease